MLDFQLTQFGQRVDVIELSGARVLQHDFLGGFQVAVVDEPEKIFLVGQVLGANLGYLTQGFLDFRRIGVFDKPIVKLVALLLVLAYSVELSFDLIFR